ncbi:hypothetical protein GUJ93_ZPchr0013g35994 [Zizania palustris]|uniref:Autophagy-related protein 9 n=1 Tax=Zizania palustris TaxID=103762 RepID=A0A8J5WWB3_ZIZPA|nr:hypothetical protein GUJ93_ZPchr0013g35994 [Zizania palustris]
MDKRNEQNDPVQYDSIPSPIPSRLLRTHHRFSSPLPRLPHRPPRAIPQPRSRSPPQVTSSLDETTAPRASSRGPAIAGARQVISCGMAKIPIITGLPSSGNESPSGLLHGEGFKEEPIADLDIFFERLYEYFCAKGLRFVDWNALGHLKCGVEALESGEKPCDLMQVIKHNPLVPFTFPKMITIGSMVILTIYGLINFLKFFVQLRSTLNIRDFYCNSLKVTDLEIQTISWPRIIEKVVLLQKRNHLILPKALEWTLNWCIFQSMFDSKFCVRKDFLTSPAVLKKRLVFVGISMLMLSPCLVIFPLVYLILRHAEEIYNHPSTASSRRWSNLSRWIFREYNEADHFFRHRMNNSAVHSLNYLKQFPTPLISIMAKFISFVSGGLAGALIIIGFLGESILEGHSKVVADELQVIDPEGAMCNVVQQTHYMPKRWRGKEDSELVRREFETLFQRVDDILRFISDFTIYVDGVGDVCSLSLFDFRRHGNRNYGSPFDALKTLRSSQGKMEKSFLSFQSVYPSWESNAEGKQFLSNLQKFKEKQIRQQALAHYQAMEASGFVASTRDQRSHPYILDWYYMCHPPHLDRTEAPHLDEAFPEPSENTGTPARKASEVEVRVWDSDGSVEELERSYNRSWRKAPDLSETRYMDDSDIDEGFNLHFTDLPQKEEAARHGASDTITNDPTPAGLHVRGSPYLFVRSPDDISFPKSLAHKAEGGVA